MLKAWGRRLAVRQPAGLFALLALIFGVFAAMPAMADGVAHPWGMYLQDPGSPIEERIYHFHNFLMVLITAVCIFVLGLMLWVIVRYNKWTNPTPSQTTHNVKLEVIWTLVPCLILIGVAFYSFPLLYYTDRVPTSDLTLKVTGHQWYWSYEYPDNGDINFDSHAIWDSSDVTDDQAKKLVSDASTGWLIKTDKPLRLLEVDNRVVLPVGKVVRVQIAGSDVEHSWFIPSLGVNRMAVPGHLTEVWIKVNKPGIYYGQCSMICGNGHGYMPIVIEGVSPDQFDAWAQSKKASVGQNDVQPNGLAAQPKDQANAAAPEETPAVAASQAVSAEPVKVVAAPDMSGKHDVALQRMVDKSVGETNDGIHLNAPQPQSHIVSVQN